MMNDYSDLPKLASLSNAAKVIDLPKRELMKMGARGKLIIREINGKFFVEIDSIKKMIQSSPIVQFDDGEA